MLQILTGGKTNTVSGYFTIFAVTSLAVTILGGVNGWGSMNLEPFNLEYTASKRCEGTAGCVRRIRALFQMKVELEAHAELSRLLSAIHNRDNEPQSQSRGSRRTRSLLCSAILNWS